MGYLGRRQHAQLHGVVVDHERPADACLGGLGPSTAITWTHRALCRYRGGAEFRRAKLGGVRPGRARRGLVSEELASRTLKEPGPDRYSAPASTARVYVGSRRSCAGAVPRHGPGCWRVAAEPRRPDSCGREESGSGGTGRVRSGQFLDHLDVIAQTLRAGGAAFALERVELAVAPVTPEALFDGRIVAPDETGEFLDDTHR